MYRLLFVTALCIFITIGCSSRPTMQMVQSVDGKTTILDSKNNRLIVANQSNRIVDVVNLDLTSDQVAFIKSQKEINDKKIKVNYWPSFTPPQEKYTVSLSTRYYKDNCLYNITISPYDERLANDRFSIATIEFSDSSGFILEKVDLSLERWTRMVNDSGIPYEKGISGKIPMTLDNYMEIKNWNCTWHSSKGYY